MPLVFHYFNWASYQLGNLLSLHLDWEFEKFIRATLLALLRFEQLISVNSPKAFTGRPRMTRLPSWLPSFLGSFVFCGYWFFWFLEALI
jgi:hypothetical protein